MMNHVPHYFIAIPLSSSIRENLEEWQVALKQSLNYRQWVHPDDLHITLKFLGAVPDGKLQFVLDELQLVESFRSFSLRIGSMGTFGHPHQPRVLWAAVKQEHHLISLQAQIEEQMLHVGFAKETRRFRPHVTLAKRWDGPPKEDAVISIRQQYEELSYLLHVNEVVLYRIFPKHTPKYNVIKRYELRED